MDVGGRSQNEAGGRAQRPPGTSPLPLLTRGDRFLATSGLRRAGEGQSRPPFARAPDGAHSGSGAGFGNGVAALLAPHALRCAQPFHSPAFRFAPLPGLLSWLKPNANAVAPEPVGPAPRAGATTAAPFVLHVLGGPLRTCVRGRKSSLPSSIRKGCRRRRGPGSEKSIEVSRAATRFRRRGANGKSCRYAVDAGSLGPHRPHARYRTTRERCARADPSWAESKQD